jgi:hypothetical protein
MSIHPILEWAEMFGVFLGAVLSASTISRICAKRENARLIARKFSVG